MRDAEEYTETLDDRMSEVEAMDAQIAIAERRAMLRELESRKGEGAWKEHSKNGLKSGIDWSSLRFKL